MRRGLKSTAQHQEMLRNIHYIHLFVSSRLDKGNDELFSLGTNPAAFEDNRSYLGLLIWGFTFTETLNRGH